jgi:hypothetical protein
MLEALREATSEWLALTVPDLAAKLKLTERRARAVARSLEARGLVIISKEHLRWRGEGEYGHLAQRIFAVNKDAPTALLVKKGERWPYRRACRYEVDFRTWMAKRDTEFVKSGVPTFGLLVWLPENRRRWRARKIEQTTRMFGPVTEARAVELFGPEV